MIHTIVVPLDGSPFAEQALSPAHRIARRLQCTLELVHVFEPTIPWPYTDGAPVPDPQLDLDLRAESRAYLEMVAEREHQAGDVQVSATLLDGPVVKTLADYVAKLDGAFVVMTTHGRGGIARAWLGSVTDGLVRSATVPVLAIRAGRDAPRAGATGEFARVLVPLAGPHFGAEVIDLTVEIAGTAGVEYILLHVLRPPLMIPPPEPAVIQVADIDAEEEAARAFLSELADPLRRRGIQVSTEVVMHNSPARAILDFVDERQIELMGMATHGFRGVKRLLLGSVADKVLRSSPVPVLLVRPPEESQVKTRAAAEAATAAR
jgi:nucleotide-binding universal stress UspA family protein